MNEMTLTVVLARRDSSGPERDEQKVVDALWAKLPCELDVDGTSYVTNYVLCEAQHYAMAFTPFDGGLRPSAVELNKFGRLVRPQVPRFGSAMQHA